MHLVFNLLYSIHHVLDSLFFIMMLAIVLSGILEIEADGYNDIIH